VKKNIIVGAALFAGIGCGTGPEATQANEASEVNRTESVTQAQVTAGVCNSSTQPAKKLVVRLKVQGRPLVDARGNLINTPVTVSLRRVETPSTPEAYATGTLDSSSNLALYFPGWIGLSSTQKYYLVVTGTNILETWSSTGIAFKAYPSTTTYDFTTAASQAYGGNMSKNGTKWEIYNGDVNQDGIIDSSDQAALENDKSCQVTGAAWTDLNGDLVVNSADIAIADANVANYVMVEHP
jgi:hypothetical protein